MNLRKTLAALFSPTRRLITGEPTPVQRGGLLGGRQWVVPRADCQYRRVDLSALPARQRAAAARLAVARHEPTPGAITHVTWHGGIAHLWIWSTPTPAATRGEQRWIPESLLAAPPVGDGPRLLRLVRGVEGQVWHAGHLVSSQWWAQPPAAEAWQRFLRAAGRDPNAFPAVPQPAAVPWSVTPWGDRQRDLFASAAMNERMAWTATFALVALALGWQTAALTRWEEASAAMATRLDAARAKATPLLAARERAEAVQAEIEHFSTLQDSTSDYVLMAQIIGALPEGAQLKGWLREAGKLQVSVQSSESDPRAIVAAFGKLANLADVTATPLDTGGMQLVFTLPGSKEEGDE